METISDFDAPKGQPVQSGAWSQVTSCDWGWSAAGAQVSADMDGFARADANGIERPDQVYLLCTVPPWVKPGAMMARASHVTWDVIIGLHQAGR
jgi:hypothetical protein